MDNYDSLKIKNQLCFPLYAAAKEIVKRYTPFLSDIDLTYTQYIAMMVIWEEGTVSIKELGEKLYLDSGTLTPLIKKLEQKGFVEKHRDKRDERKLNVSPTAKGMALREKAACVPEKMSSCVVLTPEEGRTLYKLLYKLLRRDGEGNNA